MCDGGHFAVMQQSDITRLFTTPQSTACKSLPAQAKGVRGGTGRDSAKVGHHTLTLTYTCPLPAFLSLTAHNCAHVHVQASDVRSELDIGSLKPGSVDKFWLSAGTGVWHGHACRPMHTHTRPHTDAMGTPIVVPVVVVRGARWGHTVGVVAALHGNEINGVWLWARDNPRFALMLAISQHTQARRPFIAHFEALTQSKCVAPSLLCLCSTLRAIV